MNPQFDDAVVGAGILGLAHAYHLARRGRRVLVLEKGAWACGASVRNFGMLWPIGQPAGPLHALAGRSLTHWLAVLPAAGLWHARCGSLHLAYHQDEAQVLREFAREAPHRGYDCTLLTADQIQERAPAVQPTGLQAGLWSPVETCVDPRAVLAGLPPWLARAHGVEFAFGYTVTAYDRPYVRADGREWSAGRLWVCAGDDFQTLFADAFRASGLTLCKLQMMRARPPAAPWRLGPMLAAGLTLRHYAAFAGCPSLPALVRRLEHELPEYVRLGIHVMAAQNGHGEVVLGDSHESGEAIEPFDKTRIDDLILAYLHGFLAIPDLEITSRWHGVYAKHPTQPFWVAHPADGVTVVTGVGGAGMTLSFGLAEQVIDDVIGGSYGD